MEGGNPWANATDDIFAKSADPTATKDVPVVKHTKKNKNKGGNKKQAPPAEVKAEENNDKTMKVDEEEHKIFKSKRAHKVQQKKEIKVSTEEGFTGAPETWFDDASFKKDLIADFTHKEGGDYYFDSYSNFHIHEEMLKDKIRTKSYQNAIEGNPDAFKDKIVLDIGCGTGVLSIFAARAGAKHVYGIDNADIVHYAREIVNQNGFTDQITIIKGKVEEIELPVEKVDIIVSEWMGYFLLFESMMDTVLFARDKWLVKGGIILPDKCIMRVAGIEDEDYKHKKLHFWDNVYGINMSCLSKASFVEPIVDAVDHQSICSTVDTFAEFDLNTVQVKDLEYSTKYSIEMKREDGLHGIVTWFDIVFGGMKNEVRFSTGPFAEYTHWKQTVFYFDGSYDVGKGDILEGSIACRKSKDNFRACDIKISYNYIPPSDCGIAPHKQIQQYKLR
jgi:protein arginine N-methyltransferase 1